MNENKKIIHLLILISALFLLLLSYLLYFNMFMSEKVAANPYNMRQWEEEKLVQRGNIYDRNGLLLAESLKNEDGTSYRSYPEKKLYSHVIGYYSKIYGKSLLEREYDSQLNGKGDISLNITGVRKGYNLNLTIDNKIQKAAYNALKGRCGSAIAMNPATGEILAMVSLPDFDPNAESLEKNWGNIVESEQSPLLNRATSGLYPPGSTFKIVTSAAAFENRMTDRTFNDTGKFVLGTLTVNNYNNESLGNISFNEAFKYSSNQVFCSLGAELGGEKLSAEASKFLIGNDIAFDVETAKSRIGYKSFTEKDAALFAIGQGKLLVTPLNMLLVCSAVANNGKIVSPHLVGSVTKESGMLIQAGNKKNVAEPLTPECAAYLKELMTETVNSGTGKGAKINGVTVAGKTGTAENEKEKSHSWFVGFAPAENPQIAVAVVLENDGGSGGKTAAPVAKAIMESAIDN